MFLCPASNGVDGIHDGGKISTDCRNSVKPTNQQFIAMDNTESSFTVIIPQMSELPPLFLPLRGEIHPLCCDGERGVLVRIIEYSNGRVESKERYMIPIVVQSDGFRLVAVEEVKSDLGRITVWLDSLSDHVYTSSTDLARRLYEIIYAASKIGKKRKVARRITAALKKARRELVIESLDSSLHQRRDWN